LITKLDAKKEMHNLYLTSVVACHMFSSDRVFIQHVQTTSSTRQSSDSPNSTDWLANPRVAANLANLANSAAGATESG